MFVRCICLYISLFVCGTVALAQKKECKQKPKRFPSSFSHMSSDYADMNLQSDVMPKRYFQFESGLLLATSFKNNETVKDYAFNQNLVRIGMGTNYELRGTFAIPGRNILINNPEVNTLHSPLGFGVKVNFMAESSSTPGVSLSADYVYYNAESHFQTALIIDKQVFKVLKLSMSAGPQVSINGTSKMTYSLGIVMKDRAERMGFYTLVADRYAYLSNIVQMGIVYSDNLNYQLTLGCGIQQDHGVLMVSYSGLLNYSVLQSKYGGYFK